MHDIMPAPKNKITYQQLIYPVFLGLPVNYDLIISLFTGNCTAGYHLDNSTNTCKNCSKGYYQDKKWQETCIKCNTEETTEEEGSDSKSDCKRE